MDAKKILLLGVGNILYRDEGLGVYAVQELEKKYDFPDTVSVVDGGVMGKLLMSVLMDHDLVIVADAVLGGGEPGDCYRLTDEGLRKSLGFRDSQHDVDLVDTLISCELIGKRPETVVIGMEPGDYLTMSTDMTPACLEKFPKFLGHILEELEAAGVKVTEKKA